jgi:hypothetical protein
MNSLQDIRTAIAGMSPEELAELREFIGQQTLQHDIEALLADAEPERIPAGTVNMAQLRTAAEAMWSGLDDDETEALVAAMNIKNVKDDGR